MPQTVTSPLPVGDLPSIPAASPALKPGGNAATLFPPVAPEPATTPGATTKDRARPVANTSALPQGAQVIGGQLIGLAALAVAFVLAVVRLSVRRRPAPGGKQPADTGNACSPTEQPGDTPGSAEPPE